MFTFPQKVRLQTPKARTNKQENAASSTTIIP
jgi:hypothetical protein